jgi:hypothetical protein
MTEDGGGHRQNRPTLIGDANDDHKWCGPGEKLGERHIDTDNQHRHHDTQ